MTKETTNATELRKDLEKKLDSVSQDKVNPAHSSSLQDDVVMLPLLEYNSWKETLYLLSTKANRDKLEQSISEMDKGEITSLSLKDLWK